jgi:hypothetical protein
MHRIATFDEHISRAARELSLSGRRDENLELRVFDDFTLGVAQQFFAQNILLATSFIAPSSLM